MTYDCPSPGDCSFDADDATALLEHVNTDHPGEYQRDGWPDTEAGRASRESGEDDEEE